jgi:SAM-dependent methyltransferase
LICPLCHRTSDDTAERCPCGFRFVVSPNDLRDWFDEIRLLLEQGYLAAETSWEQSGKSGSFEEWTRLRIPVSECIDASGTFLDIGCANGFLLECLLNWTRRKGIRIEPYGLDYSEKLAALARQRLKSFSKNIFVGNAWSWEPPMRFDYVRTEICYVPMNLAGAFVSRLLSRFLTENGKLLVAQYRSRRENLAGNWIDDHLRALGFSVTESRSGFSGDGLELTRVAILQGSER